VRESVEVSYLFDVEFNVFHIQAAEREVDKSGNKLRQAGFLIGARLMAIFITPIFRHFDQFKTAQGGKSIDETEDEVPQLPVSGWPEELSGLHPWCSIGVSYDGTEHLHQIPRDSMTWFAKEAVELERVIEEGKSGEVEASAGEDYAENIRGIERRTEGKYLEE
jgi:hypothetical protein